MSLSVVPPHPNHLPELCDLYSTPFTGASSPSIWQMTGTLERPVPMSLPLEASPVPSLPPLALCRARTHGHGDGKVQTGVTENRHASSLL